MTDVAERRQSTDRRRESEIPPPHNLEAERAILGAILVDQRAIDLVADRLTPAEFYRDAHRRIYSAQLALFNRGVTIDFLTLKNELARAKALDEVGGASYIASLGDGVPRSTNVAYYAGIVREKAIARNVITLASQILDKAYQQDSSAVELVDAAERGLLEISRNASPGELVSSAELVQRFYPVFEAMNSGTPDVGVQTGFAELDKYTLGFGAGETIILAGLTSSGKTSLAMQIALHVAQTVPVTYFSLEMTPKQQMLRIISTLASVDGHKMRMGRLNVFEQQEIGSAMVRFAGLNFALDGSPNLTALQVRSRVRREKAKNGVGLVVVDYLQKMKHPPAERHDLRVAASSEILNNMAAELEVPLLVLSQFSRGVAKDQRRPQLSDLRDSGSIEQDAGMVLLIHRPQKTTEYADPATELIVAKQRNGPPATVELKWLGEQYRFVETQS